MLNNSQIKLVQVAVRAAGLRGKGFDGRYRLLLGQYHQPNGQPVTSCKQLNNWQIDDLLAICESHGWRCPGKADDDIDGDQENRYLEHPAANAGQGRNPGKVFVGVSS